MKRVTLHSTTKTPISPDTRCNSEMGTPDNRMMDGEKARSSSGDGRESNARIDGSRQSQQYLIPVSLQPEPRDRNVARKMELKPSKPCLQLPHKARDGRKEVDSSKDYELSSEPCTAEAVPAKPLQPQQAASEAILEPSSSEDKLDKKKSGNTTTKKDRSKLRKGKWTVEEEEFTSRAIQQFSAGLLTLPEGATLRSYLADKLNCDPMRITKKFTGACCLGRRVYQLRERPRASPVEKEMAKAERDHLEHRFRMRVEHEQSGLPSSRRQEMLLAQPQNGIDVLYPMQNLSSGSPVSPLLQNFSSAGLPTSPPLPLAVSGNQGMQAAQSTQNPFGTAPSATGQWLLPNFPETAIPIAQASGQPDQSLEILKNLVASWAASLSPSLSQLALSITTPAPATNIIQQQQQRQQQMPNEDHHRQLRTAFEEQKKKEEQRQFRAAFEEEKPKEKSTESPSADRKTPSSGATASLDDEVISPTEQLQRSYEAHLQAIRKEAGKAEKEQVSSAETGDKPTVVSAAGKNVSTVPNTNAEVSPAGKRKEVSEDMEVVPDETELKEAETKVPGCEQASSDHTEKEPPTADEEAGGILMGFLNSLRQSYEDAVEDKTSLPDDRKKSQHAHDAAKNKDSNNPNPKEMPADSESRSISSKTPRAPTVSNLTQRTGKRSWNNRPATNASQKSDVQIAPTPRFRSITTSHSALRPASVTDTSNFSRSETSSGDSSSQPTESSSSLEDSDSKSDKTDPSSSEESEKEPTWIRRSKGPPRKRLKMYKEVKEFTTKNLIEHSKRMRQEFEGPVDNDNF